MHYLSSLPFILLSPSILCSPLVAHQLLVPFFLSSFLIPYSPQAPLLYLHPALTLPTHSFLPFSFVLFLPPSLTLCSAYSLLLHFISFPILEPFTPFLFLSLPSLPFHSVLFFLYSYTLCSTYSVLPLSISITQSFIPLPFLPTPFLPLLSFSSSILFHLLSSFPYSFLLLMSKRSPFLFSSFNYLFPFVSFLLLSSFPFPSALFLLPSLTRFSAPHLHSFPLSFPIFSRGDDCKRGYTRLYITELSTLRLMTV